MEVMVPETHRQAMGALQNNIIIYWQLFFLCLFLTTFTKLKSPRYGSPPDREVRLPDVVNWRPKVVRPMSKGAVETVFYTVPPGICFMDASASLIIPQVVLALCVTSGPVQVRAAENKKQNISLELLFYLPSFLSQYC